MTCHNKQQEKGKKKKNGTKQPQKELSKSLTKYSGRSSRRGGSVGDPPKKGKTYEDYKRDLEKLLDTLINYHGENSSIMSLGHPIIVKNNVQNINITYGDWLSGMILKIQSSEHLKKIELPEYTKIILKSSFINTDPSNNIHNELSSNVQNKIMAWADRARIKVFMHENVNEILQMLNFFVKSVNEYQGDKKEQEHKNEEQQHKEGVLSELKEFIEIIENDFTNEHKIQSGGTAIIETIVVAFIGLVLVTAVDYLYNKGMGDTPFSVLIYYEVKESIKTGTYTIKSVYELFKARRQLKNIGKQIDINLQKINDELINKIKQIFEEKKNEILNNESIKKEISKYIQDQMNSHTTEHFNVVTKNNTNINKYSNEQLLKFQKELKAKYDNIQKEKFELSEFTLNNVFKKHEKTFNDVNSLLLSIITNEFNQFNDKNIDLLKNLLLSIDKLLVWLNERQINLRQVSLPIFDEMNKIYVKLFDIKVLPDATVQQHHRNISFKLFSKEMEKIEEMLKINQSRNSVHIINPTDYHMIGIPVKGGGYSKKHKARHQNKAEELYPKKKRPPSASSSTRNSTNKKDDKKSKMKHMKKV